MISLWVSGCFDSWLAPKVSAGYTTLHGKRTDLELASFRLQSVRLLDLSQRNKLNKNADVVFISYILTDHIRNLYDE